MSEHHVSPPPLHPPASTSLRPPESRDGLHKAGVLPTTSIKGTAPDQAPISLVGESETHASKIQAFGIAGTMAHQSTWKRQTIANGTGALRIRTFHGRLSDEGLAYMDEKINQWIDEHPDIEVKHVTSTVGIYETKTKDPALILNVWY